jgi:large subunit ribosomal protein L29
MKPSKMREMAVPELIKRENELKEELYNLRFQNHTGQLENPMRLRIG